MKVLVYSANLGEFDKRPVHEPQNVACDFKYVTENDYPLRFNSMTPRLQARIVKMFGWQMFPGYDVLLWIDSSCRLARKDSVEWFLKQLGEADVAVFKHPHRKTIQEEADYLKERLELERTGKKQLYVLPRYENEDIDGILSEVDPQGELYASTAFIYKNDWEVPEAMEKWWYLTSRYHSIDQLGFTEAMQDLDVNVIPEKYMDCPYLEYLRVH